VGHPLSPSSSLLSHISPCPNSTPGAVPPAACGARALPACGATPPPTCGAVAPPGLAIRGGAGESRLHGAAERLRPREAASVGLAVAVCANRASGRANRGPWCVNRAPAERIELRTGERRRPQISPMALAEFSRGGGGARRLGAEAGVEAAAEELKVQLGSEPRITSL
jgi:hypothetical protein